jgi:hypothetical protein
LPIEQNTQGVHQEHAQQAIAQVPPIRGPDPFDGTSICQLPKDGINALAHPAQHRTPTVCRLGTGFAKGSQQHYPDLSQGFLQGGQPVVAVAQQQSLVLCRQIPDDLAFMHIGWGQLHLSNHPWPTPSHMQAKAREGLRRVMIFAKTGSIIKAVAAVGPRKLAERNGHAIDNGYRRVVEQERITDQTPQPLFERPHIGRLAHERTAIHLRHRGKKVGGVTAKIVKDFLVLTQTQVGSHHFDGHHFAVGQLGHRSSCSQAFSFRCRWQHLVNQTETCDNKVVQVHDVPPHQIAQSSEDSRPHEPFPWQELLAHRVS